MSVLSEFLEIDLDINSSLFGKNLGSGASIIASIVLEIKCYCSSGHSTRPNIPLRPAPRGGGGGLIL